MNPKVIPMLSARSGEPIRNQYVIRTGKLYHFQSYDSLVASYDASSRILTLGLYWDYSVTTMKYLNQFIRQYCHPVHMKLPLGKSGADSIRKAIESGLVVYDERMV